jgi:predicted dehydrogenase
MNKREEVSVVFQGTKAGGMVRRLFGTDGLDNTAIDACELYTQENGRPVNRSIVVSPDESMGRVRSATNFIAWSRAPRSRSTPRPGARADEDHRRRLQVGRDRPAGRPVNPPRLFRRAAPVRGAARLFPPHDSTQIMKLNRKLRMGMVGGGRGAFIGSVHRMAASPRWRDRPRRRLFLRGRRKSPGSPAPTCTSNPPASTRSYQEMAAKEAALPADQRIDFVSIVTRNNTHVPSPSVPRGRLHVICDKPLVFSLAEGRKLREVVRKSGKVFALTHNYTGYPMVKEAASGSSGKLGKLTKVVVEYPQGYAITALEAGTISKISNWRMDPNVSGVSNCMGDIGTHAHNLARYITGLEVEEICAELSTYIPGPPAGRRRQLPGPLLRAAPRACCIASQISNGDENNINIRIYGTKCSFQWFQEDPNELIVKKADAPQQIHRRGNGYHGDAAKGAIRTPFAHPEGFIEAFANIYRSAAVAIADAIEGRKAPKQGYDFPTVDDGLAGMAFVESAVKSAKAGARWVKFPKA